MEFQNWVSNIIYGSQPVESIIAFHFGLFQSEKGYTLYLIGSSEYNPEDSDWACNNDFEPADKYFLLPQNFQDLNWENVLEKTTIFLKEFTETEIFRKSFFADAKAITTGFDDGDILLIM